MLKQIFQANQIELRRQFNGTEENMSQRIELKFAEFFRKKKHHENMQIEWYYSISIEFLKHFELRRIRMKTPV